MRIFTCLHKPQHWLVQSNIGLSIMLFGLLTACDTDKSAEENTIETDDTGGIGEPSEACGDLTIQDNEQCDAGAGNGLDGVGCRVDCTLPVCGDGHRAPGEYCDDGNTTNGDGCDATCLTEHALPRLVEPNGSTYEIIEPNATTLFGDPVVTLSSSEHFVIRVTYDDESIVDHQPRQKY